MIDGQELSKVMITLGFNEQDISILQTLVQNKSYEATSKELNLTEGRVRHRFFRACKILETDVLGSTFANSLLDEFEGT